MDVIGVQETKISANHELHLLPRDKHCQYRGYWEHATTHHQGKGVGLLIKKEWTKHMISKAKDDNGRGIMVRFGFKGGFRLAVINCYIPSYTTDKRVEHERILAWVQQQITTHRDAGDRIILMGDFNAVVNPSIDRASDTNNSTTPELPLFPWLSARNFHDSLRLQQPTLRSYTFGEVSRIDMIWVTSDLASHILDTTTFALTDPIRSDHQLIATVFDVHALISPTPQTTLNQHYQKTKKIRPHAAEEEHWQAFRRQTETNLMRYGELD
ncbi:hypothetical protein BGZ50_001280, partial [Haplosporangium sp. Z 11]